MLDGLVPEISYREYQQDFFAMLAILDLDEATKTSALALFNKQISDYHDHPIDYVAALEQAKNARVSEVSVVGR